MISNKLNCSTISDPLNMKRYGDLSQNSLSHPTKNKVSLSGAYPGDMVVMLERKMVPSYH